MSSLVRVTGVRFRLAQHLWDGLGLARGPRDKLRLARRLEDGLGLARGLRDEFRLARSRRGGVSLTRRLCRITLPRPKGSRLISVSPDAYRVGSVPSEG